MKFQIPFTISKIEKLKGKAQYFSKFFKHKKQSKLQNSLKDSAVDITREEYLGICCRRFVFNFVILLAISSTILAILSVNLFYLFSLGFAALFSVFVFVAQVNYPNMFVNRRQRDIEKNLIPALEDILIQLNSGIPLFDVLTNISSADYGELSIEFGKAARRISAGEAQEEVLDDLGKKNPSVFFRRTLWQISNGMRSGSDMAIVVKDSIKALNEEQIIQIQNYGSKLNPLIMFYMIISVILPALSITFLTIISSMINLSGFMAMLMFIGVGVFVLLAQIMFLGLIKSRRPSLL